MPELLTPLDAAAYLHVSPRTLEKWRMHGGGPRYRKLVHRVVYTQQDLDAWVEEQVRTSTSDPGQLPEPPSPRAALHALPRRRARASRAKY
jgi:helix-turn-helix protein